MERRLLLAIVLTFVVLTAYQWLMPTQPPAPSTQAAPVGLAAPIRPPAAAPAAAPPPVVSPAEPAAAVETVRADTAERTITVDNGLVRAVFSNRGATLSAWELLNYAAPDGRPVDLVPHDVPANQPKPFSLRLDDAAKTARVNTALFAIVSGATQPDAARQAWTRRAHRSPSRSNTRTPRAFTHARSSASSRIRMSFR